MSSFYAMSAFKAITQHERKCGGGCGGGLELIFASVFCYHFALMSNVQ